MAERQGTQDTHRYVTMMSIIAVAMMTSRGTADTRMMVRRPEHVHECVCVCVVPACEHVKVCTSHLMKRQQCHSMGE